MCVRRIRVIERLILWALLGFLGVAIGCGAHEAAKQAAERDVTKETLHRFGVLYQNSLGTGTEGLVGWEELQTFANQTGEGQIVEQVRKLGYEVAWGISFKDITFGTHNFLLAHRPQDTESDGAFALFLDGSVRFLKADEFKRWLDIRASWDLPQREFLERFPELDRSRRGKKTERRETASARPGRKEETPPSAGSALQVGQSVQVRSAGSWEEVKVLKILPNDEVRIRWVDWGPNFDEVVSRSELRVPDIPANASDADKTDTGPPSKDKRIPQFAQGNKMWSDESGKFQVMAELVEYEDGKVTLKKEDGSFVEVSEKELSRADQAFLRMVKEMPDF